MKLFLQIAIHTFKEDIRQRLYQAITFTLTMLILSYYAPQVYYKYITQHVYVQLTHQLMFDHKIYAHCDTLYTTIAYRSEIDSKTYSKTLLIKREQDGSETIIKSIPPKNFAMGFVTKTGKGIRVQNASYKDTCSLAPGIYYFRGFVLYYVHGIEKQYSFISDVFTIQ